MKLSIVSLLPLLAAAVSAVTVPGADTPSFYLVAASANPDANLRPLRTEGGTGGYATLSGTGNIGQFYFYQGKLTAAPRSSNSSPLRPLINSILGGTGCSTGGQLGFTEGSSSNKCAKYDTFQIQSNSQNSQLGAALTFNYDGGFYACGSSLDVYYKLSPNDSPSNCSPVTLSTVAVV